MKIFTTKKSAILLCMIFSVCNSVYAFQAEGYEWEILGEDKVRCDGFIWGTYQRIADIPGIVTNPKTGKKYTNFYVWGITYCKEVEEIIVPETVELFGDCTFTHNPNLKRIKLPSHTKIGKLPEDMFSDCTSLLELTLPKADYNPDENLHGLYIPIRFCYGCTSLEKVVIPCETEGIGEAAFQKCPNLKEIHINSVKPPHIDKYAFFPEEEETSTRQLSRGSGMTLFVPEGCAQSYRESDWGKYFTNIIEVNLSGVEDIESNNYPDDTMLIYDINGNYIKNNIDNLDSGLYIVRQGSKTRKVIIK